MKVDNEVLRLRILLYINQSSVFFIDSRRKGAYSAYFSEGKRDFILPFSERVFVAGRKDKSFEPVEPV